MNGKIEKGIFEPLKNYENYYEISRTGILQSKERFVPYGDGTKFRKVRSKVIKTRINNCGYVEVRLSKCSRPKTTFIHILLAETFIDNPTNKPEVNHINGIKTDNSLSNLEWTNHSNNVLHAYSTGLISPKGKPVYDKCLNREFINTKAAALFYQINPNTLRGYLNGQIKNNITCLEYSQVF